MSATVAVGLAAFVAVPAARTPLLRTLGRALVLEVPLTPVDVIVVAPDTDGAGTLEAADLVQRGLSSRVAIFEDPPDDVDLEFLRRGVPYEDAAARAERQLKSLGVDRIERIPRSVAGTENIGRVLPEWTDRQHLRSVIVVSMRDHSRRVNRVLARAMVGHRTQVQVRGARHSNFEPEHWWRNRRSLRSGLVELQKLMLDVVRHPFSWTP